MSTWLKKHRESILTTLGVLTALTVALVTGQASWQHIVHVGKMVGEPSAAWLPVAIDGMVITGTVMAAVDRLRGFKPRFWAIVALWWGAVLTLAFNLASAWVRGVWAMVIAVLFATAFIVSVEAVMRPSTRLLAKVADKIKAKEATPDVAPGTPVPVEQTGNGKAHASRTSGGHRGRRPGPQAAASKRKAPPTTTLKAAPRTEATPVPVAKPEPGVILATVVHDSAPPVKRDAIAAEPAAEEVAVVAPEAVPHDTVKS